MAIRATQSITGTYKAIPAGMRGRLEKTLIGIRDSDEAKITLTRLINAKTTVQNEGLLSLLSPIVLSGGFRDEKGKATIPNYLFDEYPKQLDEHQLDYFCACSQDNFRLWTGLLEEFGVSFKKERMGLCSFPKCSYGVDAISTYLFNFDYLAPDEDGYSEENGAAFLHVGFCDDSVKLIRRFIHTYEIKDYSSLTKANPKAWPKEITDKMKERHWWGVGNFCPEHSTYEAARKCVKFINKGGWSDRKFARLIDEPLVDADLLKKPKGVEIIYASSEG